MLAVVEHHEAIEPSERVGEGVDDRTAELLTEAEHLAELGISDPELEWLAERVRALS